MRTMPERVCRVLDGLTGLEWSPTTPEGTEIDLENLVYMFCHISGAGGICGNPHPDWVKLFEEIEAEVELAYYTSPVNKVSDKEHNGSRDKESESTPEINTFIS